MNTLKKISLTLLFTIGSFFVYNSYAEEIDPGNGDKPPELDDHEDIPLDGGVSLLIAAGVAYGAKKYRDYRMNLIKTNEQSQ